MKKDTRGNLKLPIALHRELSHYSIDADLTLAEVVQRAWQCYKERNTLRSTTPENSGDETRQFRLYNLNLVAIAERTREATDKLGEIISELQAIHELGESVAANPAQDEDEQFARNAAEAGEIAAGKSAELARQLQNDGSEPHPDKRHGYRKAPGGAA